MRAAIVPQYGSPDVVQLAELPTPAPGPGEVRLRVTAGTVSSGDVRLRTAVVPRGFGPIIRLAYGLTRPRWPVLGTEVAGVVDAVGEGVTRFGIGDRVFGPTGMTLGGHAQFYVAREDSALARIPEGMSDQDAVALVFGGTTALTFLEGRVRPGERVLVNGASGAVGSMVVQLARHLGATVTAVCSARNAERMRALGAAEVIDYAERDFAAEGERYDVIVDTIGNAGWKRSGPALREGGRLLLVVADLWATLGATLRSRRGSRRVVSGVARERAEDLTLLAELAMAGELQPVVDRSYDFDAIAQAHAYVESGRKRGTVLLAM